MDRLTATNRLNDGGRLLVENPQAADLDVPLTNSIIPQRGVGSVSYTRATIATVTDNEGVIRNCIAGEARFQGARRVRNYYTYSQDITNATWVKSFLTATADTAIAPDGTLTADSLISTVGTNIFTEIAKAALTTVIGNTYLYSLYVKDNGQRYLQLIGTGAHFGIGYVNFDLQSGAITATSGAMTGSIANVGNGWYRIMVSCVAIGAAINGRLTLGFIDTATSIRGSAYTGDGVKAIYIWGQQFEDVTGQSIQTPSEYVSTNVLTSTPFHGANVDGVKYFNTTLSGATISPSILKGYICEAGKTNLFLQSEDFSSVSWYKNNGSVVANFALSPSGYTNADKFVPTAGTSQSYLTQSVTVVASIYTISFYLKSAGKQFVQMSAGALISSGYVNFDIVNGVVGSSNLWSGYIEAVAGFPGMYRCSITTETVTAGTGYFSLSVVDSNSATRGATSVNNGSDSIIVWGAQFELGPNVSTYIPTTTTTVTRNVDALSYNVGNVIDLKGAVYCEIGINIPGYTNLSGFIIDRGANGRYIYANNSVTALNNYDGTNILVSNIGASYNGSVVKAATSWTGSTKSIYYGSTVPKTGAYVGTFGTGNINVGSSWNGTIRNVKVWKEPPTVEELTSITSQ